MAGCCLKGENMNKNYRVQGAGRRALANVPRICHALMLFCLFAGLLMPGTIRASAFKVLVVMSYDEAYAWGLEIKEGIDSVLAKTCTVEYVWLDTKRHLEAGEEKARQAYELYQKFQPDGVIAADDNAQSMFVVPYLRDKVKTPVMFCGVNGTPEDYGYPAANVSGILERLHIRSSIAYAQLLVPSIKKIAYMMKDNPSAQAVFRQYQAENGTYPAESVAFELTKTLNESLARVKELSSQTDALFFETMEGIRDDSGKVYTDKEVVPILTEAFAKPVISNNLYHVEYGTLCAVIKTGQEQGQTAAEMLLKAMNGTPVSEIPITKNRHGKQIINLRVMKSLGIKPGSEALKGAQLVGIEK
jgi:ABC-type uncharacterized transport system substrate-binding protein